MIYYLRAKSSKDKYFVFNISAVNLKENFAIVDLISSDGLETRAISVEQFFDSLFSGDYKLVLEHYKGAEKGNGIKFVHDSLVIIYNIEAEKFTSHKKAFIDIVDNYVGSLNE